MIFKMANGRHFNFLNVHIMSHGCHRLPNILPVHQILSKSDDLSLIYAELTICKMAAVRQLEFSKFSLCQLAFIAMLFCLPVQNFAEIGQSATELWPKTIVKIISGRPPSWIVKNIFGHVTDTEFQCVVVYQIASKSDYFFCFQDIESLSSWILWVQ